jgi:hypothetical protein
LDRFERVQLEDVLSVCRTASLPSWGEELLDHMRTRGSWHAKPGRALQDRRDKALLSVKFGALRGPDGSWLGMDARPSAARNRGPETTIFPVLAELGIGVTATVCCRADC